MRLSEVLMTDPALRPETIEGEAVAPEHQPLSEAMKPDNRIRRIREERGLGEQIMFTGGQVAKAIPRGILLGATTFEDLTQVLLDQTRAIAERQLADDGVAFGISPEQFANRTDEQRRRIATNNRIIENIEHAKEYSKRLQDLYMQWSNTGMLARDYETFRGDFMDNPSWTRALTLGFESAPMYGLAAGVTMSTGNPWAGAAILGVGEAAEKYNRAMEYGYSRKQASFDFVVDTLMMTVLEHVPMTGLLKGGSLPLRMFRGAIQEGGEEILQGYWMESINRIGLEETQNLTNHLVESFVAGAVSGGLIGIFGSSQRMERARLRGGYEMQVDGIDVYLPPGVYVDQLIKKAVDRGIPVDKMMEAVSTQVMANGETIAEAFLGKPGISIQEPQAVPAQKPAKVVISKETGKPIIVGDDDMLLLGYDEESVTEELYPIKEEMLERVRKLATALGVQIEDIEYVHEANYLDPENNREELKRRGVTDEQIDQAIAEGKVFLQSGVHQIIIDDSGQKRSYIRLFSGATPDTLYHEFAHAVEQQGGLGWPVGTPEEHAEYIADKLLKGEENSIIEMTPEGIRIQNVNNLAGQQDRDINLRAGENKFVAVKKGGTVVPATKMLTEAQKEMMRNKPIKKGKTPGNVFDFNAGVTIDDPGSDYHGKSTTSRDADLLVDKMLKGAVRVVRDDKGDLYFIAIGKGSKNIPAYRYSDVLKETNEKVKGYILDMPAIYTCKNCNTCGPTCYAFGNQNRFAATRLGRFANFYMFMNHRNELKRMLTEQLDKYKYKLVRLHSSGDIFSQYYLDWLADIVEQYPDLKFYSYTKTLETNLDYSRLNALPNFNMVDSTLPDGELNYGDNAHINAMTKKYGYQICPASKYPNKLRHCAIEWKKGHPERKGIECQLCATKGVDHMLFLEHGQPPKQKAERAMSDVRDPNAKGYVNLVNQELYQMKPVKKQGKPFWKMSREEFNNVPVIKYINSVVRGKMSVDERDLLVEQLVEQGITDIETANAIMGKFGFGGPATAVQNLTTGKPVPSVPIEGDFGAMVNYIAQWQMFRNIPLFAHRESIIKAIVEGENVPQSVIDEYDGWMWPDKSGTMVSLKEAVASHQGQYQMKAVRLSQAERQYVTGLRTSVRGEVIKAVMAFKAGMREGRRMTIAEIKQYQTQFIDLIRKSNLDPKDKMKIIPRIKQITSQVALDREVDLFWTRYADLMDKTIKRDLIVMIKDQLKKTKPLKKGDRRVGRYDYETNKFFKDLLRYNGMTQSEAAKELLALPEEPADQMDLIRKRFLSYRANGMNASTDLLNQVVFDIIELKRIGTEAKNEQDFIAKMNKIEAIDEFTDAVEKNPADQKKIWTKIGNFYREGIANIGSMLRSIVGTRIAEALDPELYESRKQTAVHEATQRINKAAADIYGLDNETRLFDKLNELGQEVYEAVYTDERGRVVKIKLSKLHLIDIYLSIKNDHTRKAYFHHWGEDQINMLLDNLDPDTDIPFADYMQMEVQQYRQVFNEHAIKVTGIDMGDVTNYWPRTSKRRISIFDDIRMQGEVPSAEKERAKGLVLPIPKNAWMKMMRHINQAEHVRHISPRYEALANILNDWVVERAIRDKFGDGVYDSLKRHLELVSLNKISERMDAISSAWDKIVNNWVAAKVAIPNTSVFLKQLVSQGNYMEDMPVAEWTKYYFEGIFNARATFDYMWKNAPFLEARFNRGYKEAIAEAVSDAEKLNKSKNNLRKFLTVMTRSGDIAAIVYGGYPMLKYYEGKIGMQAALDKFERATLKSQQSPFSSGRSLFQNIGHPAIRQVFAFKNTASQYIRKIVDAEMARQRGDISAEKYAKTMAIYLIINPTLYTAAGALNIWLISGILRGLLGREPREWDEEKIENFYKDIMINILMTPFNAIPILDDVARYVGRKTAGQKVYNIFSMPVLDDIQKMFWKLGKEDITAEDWFEITGSVGELATGAGIKTGIRYIDYLIGEE